MDTLAPICPCPPQWRLQRTIQLFRKCHYVKTQEESRLFWKWWHWFDFWYFLNYAKPLHTFLSFFPSKYCVCRGWWEHDWVSQSVQMLKQTVHGSFISAAGWFSEVLFSQKTMYVQHYMNEGYLHCGILHWELLRHKTVSFSKVLDSFWVSVCSQHCVFSASLWPCKYEDIQVSCK